MIEGRRDRLTYVVTMQHSWFERWCAENQKNTHDCVHLNPLNLSSCVGRRIPRSRIVYLSDVQDVVTALDSIRRAICPERDS